MSEFANEFALADLQDATVIDTRDVAGDERIILRLADGSVVRLEAYADINGEGFFEIRRRAS